MSLVPKTITMLKRDFQYMIDNKMWANFCNNCENVRVWSKGSYLSYQRMNELINSRSIHRIDTLFTWTCSHEGLGYWDQHYRNAEKVPHNNATISTTIYFPDEKDFEDYGNVGNVHTKEHSKLSYAPIHAHKRFDNKLLLL